MAHKFNYLSSLNPQLFKPEAVPADTRALVDGMIAQTKKGPRILGPSDRRAVPKEALSPRAKWRTIPGPGGRDLRLRVLAPDRPKGLYLHLFSGGLVIGSADANDAMLERIIESTGMACVAPDYRLAPEHPYPAAWDDCEAAALWLVKNGKAEFGTDKLTIGGESAGATLAVPTLIRMRDKHGYTGFKGANLSYGNYDTSMSPSQIHVGALGAALTTAAIQACSDAYAPDVASRRNPDMSAIYADLRNLPPALLSVGTMDPFLDDSLFMYVRWIAAGNDAELAVYPGAPHGFNMMPLKDAKEGNARIDAFLADVIA